MCVLPHMASLTVPVSVLAPWAMASDVVNMSPAVTKASELDRIKVLLEVEITAIEVEFPVMPWYQSEWRGGELSFVKPALCFFQTKHAQAANLIRVGGY